MFRFKKQVKYEEKPIEVISKTSNEIIQEIHDSYDSSVDRLLAEANKILEESRTEDIEKGERLSKLGFINTIKAKLSKDIIFEREKAKKNAELIAYYKQNYPFQKFITREQVSEINKKYGLVCVTADCYIMDIPEKNLREIEAFKIKDSKDLVYEFTESYWKSSSTYNFIGLDNIPNRIGTNYKEEPFYISCPRSEANIRSGYSYREDSTFVLKDDIKDPIVLKPVVGGFLIISKWGLEASDPLVVNEINN